MFERLVKAGYDAPSASAAPGAAVLPPGLHATLIELVAPDASDSTSGSADPDLVVRSKTRVDVGSWLNRQCVFVCCVDAHVALLAEGRQPYVLKYEAATLAGSFYNHVSASLVLAPLIGDALHTLKMQPYEAEMILLWLQTKEHTDA